VVGFGEAGDAVDVMIEGEPVKRDVAIVQYEEGEQEGTVGRVPYHLISSQQGR
jgi:hypothetical protein